MLYIHLVCCYKKGCPHPLCKKGRPMEDLHWYPGGPSVSYVALPVPDPARLYSMEECTSCKGKECTGHFPPPRDVIGHHLNNDMLNSHHKPPSEVIYDPDNLQSITEVAKASILSVAEVKLKTVISEPFNHFFDMT